ncbi:MAG: hypothetical protein QM535_19155 [Limnohabitans sp.]|nr:hypothetical protein [Limnohabitans sp.]
MKKILKNANKIKKNEYLCFGIIINLLKTLYFMKTSFVKMFYFFIQNFGLFCQNGIKIAGCWGDFVVMGKCNRKPFQPQELTILQTIILLYKQFVYLLPQ